MKVTLYFCRKLPPVEDRKTLFDEGKTNELVEEIKNIFNAMKHEEKSPQSVQKHSKKNLVNLNVVSILKFFGKLILDYYFIAI